MIEKFTLLILLGALLFTCGIVILLTRKNTIMMLMGIELMLNAANVNLIAFNLHQQAPDGKMFALFVIIVAVCETAVGLALILNIYKHFQTSVPEDISELREPV